MIRFEIRIGGVWFGLEADVFGISLAFVFSVWAFAMSQIIAALI